MVELAMEYSLGEAEFLELCTMDRQLDSLLEQMQYFCNSEMNIVLAMQYDEIKTAMLKWWAEFEQRRAIQLPPGCQWQFDHRNHLARSVAITAGPPSLPH